MFCQLFVNVSRSFLKPITSLFAASILFTNLTFAQTPGIYAGYTPTGLQEGASAGSYPLGGFDTINMFNGNLSIAMPLLGMGKRGDISQSLILPIESAWEIQEYFDGFYNATFKYPSPRHSAGNNYHFGKLRVVQASSRVYEGVSCVNEIYPYSTLTRVFFTAADNTETMLIDERFNGTLKDSEVCANYPPANRGRIFRSTNGTAMTYISDVDIFDGGPTGHSYTHASGYLMMKDGTQYRFDNGIVSWIRDRNGNKISFVYTLGLLSNIIDSLGGQVSITHYTSTTPYDTISYKGSGGATRTIKVWYSALSQCLRPDFTVKTYRQLFPEISNGLHPVEGDFVHNFGQVSSVELPDGRRYQFYYNPYGEVARVILPTGGGYDYDYVTGPGLPYMVYRPLVKKTVYKALDPTTQPSNPPAGTVEKKEIFSASFPSHTSTETVVTVEYRNSDEVIQAMEKHYFYGNPVAEGFVPKNPVSYSNWTHGLEFKTEIFNVSSGIIGSPLRKIEQTWFPNPLNFQCPCEYMNPRIIQTTTTLLDTNLVTKQTFNHDAYFNVTDVFDYGFGAGAPGPLIRRTHTPYLTTNGNQGGVNYAADNNIHIRNLPTHRIVYDASGNVRSQKEFFYDNYGSFPLVGRPGIVQHDDGYQTGYGIRGNLTGVILRNPNRAPDDPIAEIHLHNQYDIAGNLVKAVDGRGFATNFDFSDRFGSADGEARSNSGAPELAGQFSYAFPTKVTNSLGHETYIQYDYYLRKPTDSEDANGVVTSVFYNDPLDRPTQVVLASNIASVKNQSSIVYNDDARTITATRDRDNFGDNMFKSESLYDGLGRTFESRKYETASSFIAVNTIYDALGRASQVSNPRRSGGPFLWTTTEYDSLSRVTRLTTPDGAQVSRQYSGNQVTATDQAGKKRRSETDALGRLIRVTEDPGGLNYETTYLYDVLNNLRHINQSGQGRWFSYNSLSQLIRIKNPEQEVNDALFYNDPGIGCCWSTGYKYDANGNLTEKTDARNIKTIYTYDALNRNTSVDYSNTAVNPDITRFYDNTNPGAYGKGRYWHDYAGGNWSSDPNIDHTAIDSYDPLGRPGAKRQLFKKNGVVTGHSISQTYDLAGNVKTMTYPSGRTVNYSYDDAGRLSSFSGNLGDGQTRTYSTIAQYHPAGMIEREVFGTQTPLHHKKRYNNRLQLGDLRLSAGSDALSFDRGALLFYYGSNAAATGDPFLNDPTNNGNLLRQEHQVPIAGGGFVIPQSDRYTYDAVNRISSFVEWQNDGTWRVDVATQNYGYDQWGNRRITSATGGVNNYNPTYDQASNRIVGKGYDKAGNMTSDLLTGGTMTYDAEHRLLTATAGGGGIYTYDAVGKRTRRTTAGQETWHVYGFGGELLSEYAAGAASSAPQKEYGYRNGELLIIAESGSSGISLGKPDLKSSDDLGWMSVPGAGGAANGLFAADETVATLGINEDSGSTTAYASANNNAVTLFREVSRTTAGKYGNALSFIGIGGELLEEYAAAAAPSARKSAVNWEWPYCRHEKEQAMLSPSEVVTRYWETSTNGKFPDVERLDAQDINHPVFRIPTAIPLIV